MPQDAGENFAILLKDMHELVEDLEVKCRRDHFAASIPLVAGARQQAGLQPLVEYIVVEMLIVEFAAAQNSLKTMNPNHPTLGGCAHRRSVPFRVRLHLSFVGARNDHKQSFKDPQTHHVAIDRCQIVKHFEQLRRFGIHKQIRIADDGQRQRTGQLGGQIYLAPDVRIPQPEHQQSEYDAPYEQIENHRVVC